MAALDMTKTAVNLMRVNNSLLILVGMEDFAFLHVFVFFIVFSQRSMVS